MKKICIFLTLVTALTSCVKDVILDAKEDPLLAVYCVLKVDSVQELKLSYTKSATMAEAPSVTEVTAVLTDLTEDREAGRFVQVTDTLWQLDYSAIPTHSYRLEIAVPGHDPVWAEQTMPEVPPVETLHVSREESLTIPWLADIDTLHYLSYGGAWYEDSVTITYKGVEGDFYRFHSPSHSIWAYAECIDHSTKQLRLGNLCTDYPYVDDINLTTKKRISINYSIADIYTEKWPLGDGWAHIRESYQYDNSLHRDFLRFPKDETGLQSYFNIDIVTDEKSYTKDLFFASLSDDYDRYLCDAYQQYYTEQNGDLASIYIRDNLPGNIHGGTGIFGAATVLSVGSWVNYRGTRVLYIAIGPGYDPNDPYIVWRYGTPPY